MKRQLYRVGTSHAGDFLEIGKQTDKQHRTIILGLSGHHRNAKILKYIFKAMNSLQNMLRSFKTGGISKTLRYCSTNKLRKLKVEIYVIQTIVQ